MQIKEYYDVIIVGAGPGGSITAKTIANANLSVLLIEKRQEIGDPVRCAEAVGKDTLEKHIQPNPRWICAYIKGMDIYSPDGTKVEMKENDGGNEVGFVLDRKIFDRALVHDAAIIGAEVRVKARATDLIIENDTVCGVKIMHFGNEFEVRSKIVIGADGVESKVGRWAGINTTIKPSEIETCVQYLVSGIDIDQNICKFYVGNKSAPNGYVWIFPKGDGLANVGVGILGSKSGEKRAIDYLNEFMKQQLPNGKIIEIVIGGVPVSGPIKRTIANGLMLVGDAARQSDPITGGGIINAMDAGLIAGEVAINAIKKQDVSVNALEEYEKRWRLTIGREIANSLIIKKAFTKFTDNNLNELAHSLYGVDLFNIGIMNLLSKLFKVNKKLLWDIRELIKEYTKNEVENNILNLNNQT
jgi:digeranylgeranylglycerophospholipid reductase